MLTITPQYIKDSDGKKSMVILPLKEFNLILEQLDELEDIRLYDEAKREDDGERIPMEKAFEMIETERKRNDL